MRRFIAFLTFLFLLPAGAFALDYTDRSAMYADGPFTTSEAVGISVLTNLGVVQGYPDRTFRAGKRINRAEFLKIALLSKGEGGGEGATCFADVHAGDWFSPFVCQAKSMGIVQGYAGNVFRPDQPVTYAEAVKILVVLYGYPVSPVPGTEWYEPYLDAASQHGVLTPLPGNIHTYLPRGAMARLAAAFRAEHDGELDQYRAAEKGQVISSSSASTSSSSSTSSSTSSASSMSSSSSSSANSISQQPPFPVRSHFLIIGSETAPIAGATFSATLESLKVRSAEVKLKTKINSIDALFLVDGDGKKIGQLSLYSNDDTDKTWRGTFEDAAAYVIPKGQDKVLGVIARLKPRDSGGSSDQLVQVDTFRIGVVGVDSQESYNSSPGDIIYPKHQTAQAHIVSVKNAGADREVFVPGPAQILGAFTFSAEALESVHTEIHTLEFTVSKPAGVAVSGWQLGAPNSATRINCSVNDVTVTCGNIPPGLGTVSGPTTLRLFGDVSLDQGVRDPFLQVSLGDAGGVGFNGAVRWSDGSGEFTWVELDSPVAKGTLWK